MWSTTPQMTLTYDSLFFVFPQEEDSHKIQKKNAGNVTRQIQIRRLSICVDRSRSDGFRSDASGRSRSPLVGGIRVLIGGIRLWMIANIFLALGTDLRRSFSTNDFNNSYCGLKNQVVPRTSSTTKGAAHRGQTQAHCTIMTTGRIEDHSPYELLPPNYLHDTPPIGETEIAAGQRARS